MKQHVEVTAIKPASSVLAITRYLKARGWKVIDRPTTWINWGRGSDDEFVSMPKHSKWADYGRRITELLRDLARIEGRDSADVLHEIVALTEPQVRKFFAKTARR